LLTDEQKQKITAILDKKIKEKSGDIKCPMCGNKNFILVDAYLRNELQQDFKTIALGGPAIPSVAIICNNCGFMSQHVLGVLGLNPIEKEDKDAGK